MEFSFTLIYAQAHVVLCQLSGCISLRFSTMQFNCILLQFSNRLLNSRHPDLCTIFLVNSALVIYIWIVHLLQCAHQIREFFIHSLNASFCANVRLRLHSITYLQTFVTNARKKNCQQQHQICEEYTNDWSLIDVYYRNVSELLMQCERERACEIMPHFYGAMRNRSKNSEIFITLRRMKLVAFFGNVHVIVLPFSARKMAYEWW